MVSLWGKRYVLSFSFSNKSWYYYGGQKNNLQKVTNIYGMTTVLRLFLKRKLWYYYHGSNEQRVIEIIRLLFFIVKGVTCAIIKQINKSLRKESKVVQTKKQYWDFSLTALSFASISIFSGWTKRVNSIWTFNSDTLFIIG